MVVQGHAILVFKDEDKKVALRAGDYVNIPAHKKHRVEWTDPDKETIWLAIFYTK
jgi:cupin 2 domain-containing protein